MLWVLVEALLLICRPCCVVPRTVSRFVCLLFTGVVVLCLWNDLKPSCRGSNTLDSALSNSDLTRSELDSSRCRCCENVVP